MKRCRKCNFLTEDDNAHFCERCGSDEFTEAGEDENRIKKPLQPQYIIRPAGKRQAPLGILSFVLALTAFLYIESNAALIFASGAVLAAVTVFLFRKNQRKGFAIAGIAIAVSVLLLFSGYDYIKKEAEKMINEYLPKTEYSQRTEKEQYKETFSSKT